MTMFDSTRSVQTAHGGRATVVRASAEVTLSPVERNALALVAAVASLRDALAALNLPEWRVPVARLAVRTAVTESSIGGVYEVSAAAARSLERGGLVSVLARRTGGVVTAQVVELTGLGREVSAALPADVEAVALKRDGYLPAGARS